MAALEANGSASLDAVGTAAAKTGSSGGGGISSGFSSAQNACSSFMQRIHSGSQAGKPDPAFEGQPTFSIGAARERSADEGERPGGGRGSMASGCRVLLAC